MIPRDFALYDVLCCAAVAIDEAESGQGAPARAAWAAARAAACGLYPLGSAPDRAIGVILLASRPDAGPEGRAALWNALDAASDCALDAMEGSWQGQAWRIANALASRLEPGARAALSEVLGEAWKSAKERATA